MNSIRAVFFAILIFLPVLSVTGCGGGSGSGPSTGTLNLSVTDASVDAATSVIVEFTGVTIKPSSGSQLDYDFLPRQIDLLALAGGASDTILNGVTVSAGSYDWIRLKVNSECNILDSYIDINSSQTSLWVPSGSQTGLKLVSGFSVPAGGTANFTIDFDLRKSVNLPQGQGSCPGNYRLKPALRLVNNVRSGSISGIVDSILITDPSCTNGNAVYVFAGQNVIPDDVDGSDPEPLTSSLVTFDNLSQEYIHKAAFLTAGDYTISFTCQAGDDDPEADDTIAFVGTSNVSVSSGTETIHNF